MEGRKEPEPKDSKYGNCEGPPLVEGDALSYFGGTSCCKLPQHKYKTTRCAVGAPAAVVVHGTLVVADLATVSGSELHITFGWVKRLLDDLEVVFKYIDQSIMAAGGRATVEILALDAKLEGLQLQIDQAEAKLEVNAHTLAQDTHSR